jgi:TonB family protein
MRRRTFRNWCLGLALFAAAWPATADWEPAEIAGLSYPRLARSARITGTVVVRLSLADDGFVTEAEAVSGHPLLTAAACTNAREWRFRPSKPDRGGSQAAYLIYRFVLRGSCAGSQCREAFWVEYPNLVVVRSEIPPLQTSEGRPK